MSCDVGEATESLENQNELWRRWSDWMLGEWALLIFFQSFEENERTMIVDDADLFSNISLSAKEDATFH